MCVLFTPPPYLTYSHLFRDDTVPPGYKDYGFVWQKIDPYYELVDIASNNIPYSNTRTTYVPPKIDLMSGTTWTMQAELTVLQSVRDQSGKRWAN